jgi:hypothetical protein
MFRNKIYAFAGIIIFPVIALIALYRLIYWFPIEIAGRPVGQTVSFLLFIIFSVLTVMAFQDLRRRE